MSLDWATGKTETVFYDVPGIPSSTTGMIYPAESNYFVQLINGEKESLWSLNTKTGKVIGNYPNDHTFANLYYQQ
jgi:hypothetical protein